MAIGGLYMADRPRPQEIYRHFKGKLYQIITIATHSETREEMVVYQALYGDYKTYVRPLDMFMSEVDRQKYPAVTQKMRFEKVNPADTEDQKKEEAPKPEIKSEIQPEIQTERKTEIKKDGSLYIVQPESKESSKEAAMETIRPQNNPERKAPRFNFKPTEKSKIMQKSVDEEAQELNLNPLVIEFMDADLAADKNSILSKLRPVITNDMIDIMAMSLGVVVKEGDVYDRYNDLRTCLTTMEKYESTRIRNQGVKIQ